jgi:hypothetical protein
LEDRSSSFLGAAEIASIKHVGKGDASGSPSLVSQESVVAGRRNNRFLRLVEQAIPRLAA